MWLWGFVAWGACPDDPATIVQAHAAGLEQAFDTVDDDAFSTHYAALHAAAKCISSPLDARTVFAWHRARALGEFFEREEIASAKSWAAVKALDPEFTLPSEWLVEGTPLYKAWSTAPVSDERIELERSPVGGWKVDGEVSTSVPADRAFILQGLDSGGIPVHTDYHYSVAEVPVLDFRALDATARQRRRTRMRTMGTIAGGALFAGAIGTMGVAFAEELAVKSEKTDLADVRDHARQANTLSSVSLGLGAGAVGVTAVTWIVRW